MTIKITKSLNVTSNVGHATASIIVFGAEARIQLFIDNNHLPNAIVTIYGDMDEINDLVMAVQDAKEAYDREKGNA
jgi:hypothetical protein